MLSWYTRSHVSWLLQASPDIYLQRWSTIFVLGKLVIIFFRFIILCILLQLYLRKPHVVSVFGFFFLLLLLANAWWWKKTKQICMRLDGLPACPLRARRAIMVALTVVIRVLCEVFRFSLRTVFFQIETDVDASKSVSLAIVLDKESEIDTCEKSRYGHRVHSNF